MTLSSRAWVVRKNAYFALSLGFPGSADSYSQGNYVCLILNIILLILLYQDWQEGNTETGNTLLISSLRVFIPVKNWIVIKSLSKSHYKSLEHVGVRHRWTATLNQRTITQRLTSEPYKHLNLFFDFERVMFKHEFIISKHYFSLLAFGMEFFRWIMYAFTMIVGKIGQWLFFLFCFLCLPRNAASNFR